MYVSPAAVSALQENELLSVALGREFADKLVRLSVAYRRPRRHRDDDILSVLSVSVPALPVAAVLRLEEPAEPYVGERLDVSFPAEDDVSAPSAVSES